MRYFIAGLGSESHSRSPIPTDRAAFEQTALYRGDACAHCGGYRLQPTGGTELRVIDMQVED